MSLTHVSARCHCGLNIFQIPFLSSDLPLKVDMCHCNACRHCRGQMFVHCAIMEGVPLAFNSELLPESHIAADLSNLSVYRGTGQLERYFCRKCSAYLVEYDKRTMRWAVSTGSLDRVEGIVRVEGHMFLDDTLDGGLANHYLTRDGKDLPRFRDDRGSELYPVKAKTETSLNATKNASDVQERLYAYCHCRSISLYLIRPREADASDQQKWRIIPANKDDPTSKPRFIAGHCFCTSCRLTSGSLFVNNIILPREYVFDGHTGLPIGLAIPRDGSTNPNRPKGLRQYESSPGVFRESCGKCGASISYWTKKKEGVLFPPSEGEEPTIIDITVGLIDESIGGARCEGWISWLDRINVPEDATDPASVEAIQLSFRLEVTSA